MTIRTLDTTNLAPEELAALTGVPVLDPDGLDKAILGTMPNAAGELVLVYGYDELVDCTAKSAGPSWSDDAAEYSAYEEAAEWVDYNTLRSLGYMGPRAPVVLRAVEDPDEVEPDELVDFKGKKWVKA